MRILLAALFMVGLVACGKGSPAAASPPTPALIDIAAIQGSGPSSPLEGQTVSFRAAVTGDFQDNDALDSGNLGGFFVQQEGTGVDPAASTGLFVYDKGSAVDVSVGDLLQITGEVVEYFGETQVHATRLAVIGSADIEATAIELPAAGLMATSDGKPIADLEAYEGMLIRLPQTLSVANLRFLERYGELGLVAGGRPFQYTNSHAPDIDGFRAYEEEIASRSIILDDGLRNSYPASVRYLKAGPTPDYSLRSGDSVTGVTGNLRYSRGSGSGGVEAWRLEPTQPVSFSADNPRPAAPAVAGSLRVASFNMLNFFATIDSGQPLCGPQQNANCRGADSSDELSRQLEKIVTAILQMDADIIGLVELENDAAGSLSTITSALNSRPGGGDYSYLDTGTIHTDAIKTGFVFDTTSVQARGPFAILDAVTDARFADHRNRPALAQSFEQLSTGAVLTVIVNHLKSKGSPCDADGDPNMGDGQGNCNQTRYRAALALADWANKDPTGSGDPDVLIIGDLNAYPMEDPLTALRDSGFTNLLAAQPWSFVFDGKAGALDYALASESLAGQVRETLEWHINADEPALLDYNLENGRDPGLFEPDTPYRASDHDPVIIGLDLD